MSNQQLRSVSRPNRPKSTRSSSRRFILAAAAIVSERYSAAALVEALSVVLRKTSAESRDHTQRLLQIMGGDAKEMGLSFVLGGQLLHELFGALRSGRSTA